MINKYFDKKIKLIQEEDFTRLGFPTKEMEDNYRQMLIDQVENDRQFLLSNPKISLTSKQILEAEKGVFEPEYD